MKEPPYIHHQGERSAYWLQMVKDCAYNLRLSKREETLLIYYCDQANGFAPSAKRIEDQTGIPSNKISELRSKLDKRSLIKYKGLSIEIAWYHIRNFAMIPRLSKEDSKLNYFFPPLPNHLPLKKLTYRDPDAINYPEAKHKIERPYTKQEKKWIRKIENMTVPQYNRYLQEIAVFE